MNEYPFVTFNESTQTFGVLVHLKYEIDDRKYDTKCKQPLLWGKKQDKIKVIFAEGLSYFLEKSLIYKPMTTDYMIFFYHS